ncbi:MAG: TolC family protein [Myxococcales bacterium]|nr:TolC family protein [Myxococcales bacterium]
MRTFIKLVPSITLLLPAIALAQDAGLGHPDKGYESSVWAQLAPVATGFTAVDAAESAKSSSPRGALAAAEVEVALAKSRQTLSRYVPNLTVTGSASRKNLTEFNFGSGASVGALNEGPLTVGMCPGGAGNNCVLDSQGMPVGAVAGQAFETPRNTYSLDATLSVPFSDYVLALAPARKGARANEQSARLRQEAELQTADVNARIAYFDWVRAQAQLAIAEASQASSRARVEDARIGLEAGTVTSADALGLESLAASTKLGVVQAQSFLRLAEQNLRITAQYDGPLAIGEDLSAKAPSIESLGTLDELVAHGQKHRAESRALQASESAMKFAVDGANANLYPRIDGFVNVTHANPNQAFFPPSGEWNTSWMVGLNLSWRLDGYLSTKALVRELDANASVLVAQSSSLDRAIEMEVRSAWEEWQRASATAGIAKVELAASEAMHEQRILLFQGGEATSTAVVEAEIQRANATYRKVSASIDKRVALARMRRAAALDVKGASK